MVLIQTNEYQTPITEELRDSLPVEVWDDFMDIITNVEFVKSLISPDRKRAKDLPRDSYGRIIVDICHPHILENMDYFRAAAIHFQKYGCYTKLRPDANPKSEFGMWLAREIRRCLDGMIRPEDGEWIPGDFYFYLNYLPIIQTKLRKGTRIGDRVVDFPEVWEGVYLRSHYQYQARNGGMYDNFTGGKHSVEIASRGKSKSYYAAAILSKFFLLGESSISYDKVKCLVAAYQKEYLIKDGTLNKFIDGIDFCAKYTQFPRARLKNSLSEMQWVSGYLDKDTLVPKGSQNEVLGVAIKDDPDKIRGKRPISLYSVVPTPDGWKYWSEIHTGDQLFGKDGKIVNVIDETIPEEMDLYLLELQDGRSAVVGPTHPFEVIYRSAGKLKKRIVEAKFLENNTIYKNKKYNLYKFYLEKTGPVQYPHKNIPIDPYTLGLYLGDGCYKHCHSDYLDLTMLREDIDQIEKFIPYSVDKSKYRDITHKIHINKSSIDVLKSLGLNNRDSSSKFIPNLYLYNSVDVRFDILAGLLDTDGSVYKDGRVEFSSKSSNLVHDVVELCRSLGINCTLKKKYIKNVLYFRVVIYSNDSNLFKLPRKKERLAKRKNSAYSKMTAIKSVTLLEKGQAKCVTVDSEDHLHLIDEFIPTHNSNRMLYEEFGTFPKFLDVWQTALPNVQENATAAFGQAIAFGTGGSEGSDFMGALEMINYPDGYSVYSLPNVFDKGSVGSKRTIFFFPSYLNSKGFYNEDGVSDVVGAIIEEIKHRVVLKYNSSDPIQLTRRKAEYAFTIIDAIMRRDSNIFPSDKLNDRILELDQNPRSLDDMWIGRLIQTKEGKVEFTPDADVKPILDYPHKDNKLEGAIHINKMPVKGPDGKVPWGRYIAGADPYDDDVSDTMSLGAIYVLDLFTDEIVCEYVGRPMFAEDYYETCRRICLFYNAELLYENNKKGLFTYFSKTNCLYLLSDVPEFLRDKEMVKGTLYGNKAHPYSQTVYTPDGLKLWGDIKIGDKLFNSYGGTTTVIDIPFDNITDIFEITLKDGRKVKASANHLWNIITYNKTHKTISTEEMFKSFLRKKGKYNESKYYIVNNQGVEFTEKPLKLPPYFMGIMLGDGCFTVSRHHKAHFSSSLKDLETYKLNVPYSCKTVDDRHHWWEVPNIGNILKELGLSESKSHTKFIPKCYKFNSKKNRLELLKGLLDTDGHVGYGGNPEYVTVSKQLALDVEFIARSCGINCNIQTSNNSYGPVYKVIFYTDIKLFKLERKYSRQKLTKTRSFKTAIVDIKLVDKEKAKCVTVDSKDGCYLIGEFITTHNSKGVNATQPIQTYGRKCIRDWLLKPFKITTKVVVNDHEEETEITINNINRCYYRALMKELAMWNPDNNFDRYDALLMLMLLREQKLMLCGMQSPSEVISMDQSNYLGNDEFFTTNYDFRLKK